MARLGSLGVAQHKRLGETLNVTSKAMGLKGT